MAKKQTHTTKGLRPPKKHLTKTHAKVYWPYLPLIALLLGAAFLNIWQPLQSSKPATLAYATEMSRSGLLSATNGVRNGVGAGSLTLNDKLNAAAQAKANDMVARNYWAHNTPEGQEPWIFIDAQGYAYTKAGENLAYGHGTSSNTIVGWVNSPSHYANMIDTAFTEVGFGFANAPDYIPRQAPSYTTVPSVGNQTIVVAMYGKPVVASVTPAPVAEPAPQAQTAPASTNASPAPVAEAAPVPVVEQPAPEPEIQEEITDNTVVPVNTDNPVTNVADSQRTSRIQLLTRGAAPWSAVALSIAAFTLAVIWLIKHFVIVKRYLISGEHFVAHHPILDLIVLSILAAALYLSQTTGVIL
jgi:uncharacterized protein YkwD